MPTPPVFVADEVVTAAKMNTLPKGVIGYAYKTADQGSITAEADVTSLTVTFTAGSGRIYKATAIVRWLKDGTGAAVTTRLTDGSNTSIQAVVQNAAASEAGAAPLVAVVAPSAGSYTLKVRIASASGAVTAAGSASGPSIIVVEDIGAV